MARKRGKARTFGQDLMRGEHTVGQSKAAPVPPLPEPAADGIEVLPLAFDAAAASTPGIYPALPVQAVEPPAAEPLPVAESPPPEPEPVPVADDASNPRRHGDNSPGGGGGGCWLKGRVTESSERFQGPGLAMKDNDWVRQKIAEGELNGGLASGQTGTSIFDPVLCELVYRWFCPIGGTVLDPFAGGSVRGIVASKLGRRYIGQELRAEQVAANHVQGVWICKDDPYPPQWVVGDSREIDRTCGGVQADFIFSCPPYADLEVYSDDPRDISTFDYPAFKAAYFEIIRKTCAMLRADRFACFVVGECRGRDGNYYNFVGDTVEAFRAAGLNYYNEGILLTAVGSLPIRVGRQFSASRKLGKTHQNVLVFVKGSGKAAAANCGPVEVGDLEAFAEGGTAAVMNPAPAESVQGEQPAAGAA